MKVTTFEGKVENGQIRLPPDVSLPEKAKVYVIIPASVPSPPRIVSPRLAHPEQAEYLTKELIAETLAKDTAGAKLI